jgi:hypothetical protein
MRAAAAGRAAIAVAGVATVGCTLLGIPEERPAVITNASAATLAELTSLVSAALNGAPVRLADDSLTRESTLIVDRSQPRDAAGLPLDGRTLDKPDHFVLVTHGTDCVLIHERTHRRDALKSAVCRPADVRKT